MIKDWIFSRSCVACGREFEQADQAIAVTDPFKIAGDTFRIACCGSCRTWILNPRPSQDEMARFYQEDFLYLPPSAAPSFLQRLSARVQRANLASEVNWVCQNLPRNGRYLDYSAGNGQILAAVLKKRPDTRPAATEFSAPYRKMIAERLPHVPVHQALEDLGVQEKFDVISAFCVFEHVEDPRRLLNSLADLLSDDGCLLISVPNPAGAQRRIFGSRWYNWLAPRHFQLMPRKTFLAFARESGLHLAGEHHFFLRTGPGSLVLSVFPGLDPLQSPGPTALLFYAALFCLSIPVEALFALIKAGGFMGFAMKKTAR